MNTKQFLQPFKEYGNSLSEANWYAHIITRSFWVSITTTFVSYAFLLAIAALSFRLHEVPRIIELTQKSQSELVQKYPKDLVVTIDQNQVTSSSDMLPIPWLKSLSSMNELDHLALLAPQFDSLETLPEFEVTPLFVILKTQLLVSNQTGGWTTFPLSDIFSVLELKQPLTISSENIESVSKNYTAQFRDVVLQYWWMALPILAALFVLDAVFMTFFYGVFVWLLGKLSGYKLTLLATLRIVWHVSLVAITLSQLFTLLTSTNPRPLQAYFFWIPIAVILILNRNSFSGTTK